MCKPVDVAEHILVDPTGGFGIDDEFVVVEVDLAVQVVDGFLDEVREILVLLDEGENLTYWMNFVRVSLSISGSNS